MSNFIIEEERGISTARHHSHNGYYAFEGPIVRTIPNPPVATGATFAPGQARTY